MREILSHVYQSVVAVSVVGLKFHTKDYNTRVRGEEGRRGLKRRVWNNLLVKHVFISNPLDGTRWALGSGGGGGRGEGSLT